MKNIYVGNLDFKTTVQELHDLFARHGKVVQVSIPHDNVTDKARGFAFVEMPDDVEAERAIHALNGSTLKGRTLIVNEARRKPQWTERRPDGERRFGRS